MGWLDTLPAAIIVDMRRVLEYRPSPTDDAKQQKRTVQLTTLEYRGMTKAKALSELANYPKEWTNRNDTAQISKNAGGGYTLVVNQTTLITGWTDAWAEA